MAAKPDIFDAVIVGAGPAGAAAAITLQRAGRSVVVIDKATFPRDKFCGDGLTTGALHELERLGLDPGSVASWHRVDDVVVRSPLGREVTFALPRTRGQYMVVARRADLDAALVRLARDQGATVLDGHALTGVVQRADCIEIHANGIDPIRATVAIGADGMWSPLRHALGATIPHYLGEWHAFRQYFAGVTGRAATQMFIWFEPSLLPGYMWSFPLGNQQANVGFGVMRSPEVQTGAMKQMWPALLERAHVRDALGPDARPEAAHRAWPIPARIDRIALTARRALFAGDAAAATDVMTGEGIAQALITGRLAASSVIDGARDEQAIRTRYERAVQRELFADHRMSVRLQRALAHRRSADAAVRLAGITPWARRNFIRWLLEDYPRALVVTPRRWRRGVLRSDGAYAHQPCGTGLAESLPSSISPSSTPFSNRTR